MSAGSHCSCSQGRAGQDEFKLLQCRNKNCVFAHVWRSYVGRMCGFGVIIELLRGQLVKQPIKKQTSTQCEVTLPLRHSAPPQKSIKPGRLFVKLPPDKCGENREGEWECQNGFSFYPATSFIITSWVFPSF